MSRQLCIYFACQGVGERSFLIADYRLECGTGGHQAFVPFVALFLVGFTFLFPIAVLSVLCRNRKKLHTPAVQHRYGFLYNRFTAGAEMWELHEVFRKLVLMGVLIFFPPATRAATAILVCVAACCSLNYYRPHRNRIVLGVAQAAFLLTSFKYVVAVLVAQPDDGRTDVVDREAMGWLMVGLDILFMLGSAASAAAVAWLLRAKVRQVRAAAAGGAEEKEADADAASTKVVPMTTKAVDRQVANWGR